MGYYGLEAPVAWRREGSLTRGGRGAEAPARADAANPDTRLRRWDIRLASEANPVSYMSIIDESWEFVERPWRIGNSWAVNKLDVKTL